MLTFGDDFVREDRTKLFTFYSDPIRRNNACLHQVDSRVPVEVTMKQGYRMNCVQKRYEKTDWVLSVYNPIEFISDGMDGGMVQDKNGPACAVKYLTLTEHGHETAASADASYPMSEISSGPLLFPLTRSPYIRYPISSQEVSNALMTPLGLRVSMGGGDYSVMARLPLDFAISRKKLEIVYTPEQH
ncbi:hypothetical protein EVAR_18892_1 [Eumeta japonica]|uniref:Uncharacterized protein n=1 Tax=Eumeta variegata TaxID=151549 RepID=A0A4C1V2I5_EUMVA|nr:hypothetical protein EVAR_18892_1 [Eumeta japonica]